jgi:hypothetical protein
MNRLNAGQDLLPGQSLESTNRLFVLTYQIDGNLVLYDHRHVPPRALWTSRTQGTEPGRVILQTDGNLVLYDPHNAHFWESHTAGLINVVCILQDDSNLVIYSNEQARWDAKSDDHWIFYPILEANEKLVAGDSLKSPNQRFLLIYQPNGNLVLLDTSSIPNIVLWDAASTSTPGMAIMQDDGNFVVLDSNSTVKWHAGTNGRPQVHLQLQDDGNLVLYSHDGPSITAVWNAKEDPRWRRTTPETTPGPTKRCGWVRRVYYDFTTGESYVETTYDCWWE